MDAPTAADLKLAVDAMSTVLVPAQDQDWRELAGDLEWSCWATAAHIAHDLLAYASQLSVRPPDAYLPIDLLVRAEAPVPAVLEVVRSCAGLLAMALRAAGPDARAWHWGLTDRTGFAALGLNEVLVHTWYITQGLGVPWHPPRPLAALVVQRLFTQAPAGDPSEVLLWSTGRIALPDHPRQARWVPSPPPPARADQAW